MAKLQIVSVTQKYVEYVAANMRQADVDEAWASNHMGPLEALESSVEMSRGAKAGLANGEVFCIFGTARASALSFNGIPWLLGTDKLPKYSRGFLRLNKKYIKQIKKEFDYLENYVDARNHITIKWLEWLGFKVNAPVPYGADNLPFHHFEMEGAA